MQHLLAHPLEVGAVALPVELEWLLEVRLLELPRPRPAQVVDVPPAGARQHLNLNIQNIFRLFHSIQIILGLTEYFRYRYFLKPNMSKIFFPYLGHDTDGAAAALHAGDGHVGAGVDQLPGQRQEHEGDGLAQLPRHEARGAALGDRVHARARVLAVGGPRRVALAAALRPREAARPGAGERRGHGSGAGAGAGRALAAGAAWDGELLRFYDDYLGA